MRGSRLGLILSAAILLCVTAVGSSPGRAWPDPAATRADVRVNRPITRVESGKTKEAARVPRPDPPKPTLPAVAAGTSLSAPGSALSLDPQQVIKTAQTVGLFALVSLAPAAVLMATAFVRINIVLVLLRQALGSPQVPGNQVLTALALLLTALVMRPVGETVYTRAIKPYADGQTSWSDAYQAASVPIKAFMVEQIEQTRHGNYLWALYDEIVPESPNRVDPRYGDEFPMRIVAPAFLLSELTTALVIGFYLYLPFLVVDLVVSAVLAAMGLFMLPPSMVALPLKLILFVAVDGWLHVATMLLRSFGPIGAGP
jgi:flagellar biosynthesis protein FliP